MDAAARRTSFSAHPFVWLGACCAAGVCVANVCALSLAWCLLCGLALTGLAARAYVRGKLNQAAWLVLLAFACAGAVLALVETRAGGNRLRSLYESGRIMPGEPVEVTGTLRRAPEPMPDGLLLTLRVESLTFRAHEQAAEGTVELFAVVRDATARREYEALELRCGARLRVMAALDGGAEFRNPGVTPRGEYLERRDVDARGAVKSPLLVERLGDERVFLPLVWIETWRGGLLQTIERRFTLETAGVLKAALLGNRYGLSRATAERFREGGTFHVLVISGLHITFIGGAALALMRRLTKRRVWQWALSAVVVWSYAVAVGGEASVVRAALMFTMFAHAPVVGRRSNSMNTLGAAALLLVVWRPRNLFDPSFQLTFLAVLAIVALGWPLLERLREVGEWRPTRRTPHPPACPRLWLICGETLFWSERRFRREMERATYSYRLYKTPLAVRLDRWRVQWLLRYVCGAVLISACVELMLLPLFVVYFHRLSFASLLLNIVVSLLMALLSFAALAALVLAPLSATLAQPLFGLAEAVNFLMLHSVDPFMELRLASVRLPEYTGMWACVYALYYAPLLVLVVALLRWHPVRSAGVRRTTVDARVSSRRRRMLKFAAVAYGLLAVIIITHPRSEQATGERLRIDFLDVGQGDSALLTMPDGTTLLIDGGGRPRFDVRRTEDGEEAPAAFEPDTRGIGELVVSEYLWWRGLDHVDYVLATHADADHIDGLNDVVSNFGIGAVLVGRAPARDAEYARLSATTARAHVPVYLAGRGDRLQFGPVQLDVLWPPRTTPDAQAPSGNDDSIVLRLSYGRKSFLFTGDIESRAESALVAASPDELRSDVVKVAHHGSRTSSTRAFVDATRAGVAVISVGLSSPHGHPHPEVVERWRAESARVLTTGQSGTITISTDGADLKVETFVRR